ncbi:hypothetical protein [uncultured Actinomyces sp.]|jgi:hypothetical protein|uniref:hypothetical protein n=1 Tax=uncultured Actinomyces sp. TaxID=249061 RepID=UPI0028EB41F9|nr:hypothetical protein [uncultured Actinomyces sp.]
MEALSPSMIVQAGSEKLSPDSLTDSAIHGSATWVPMEELWLSARIPSLMTTFDSTGISSNDVSTAQWGHEYDAQTPRAWWFKGGRPAATTGWWQGRTGAWYYFADAPVVEASAWVSSSGQWYWVDQTGAMATDAWVNSGGSWYRVGASSEMVTGWVQVDGTWYYMDANGVMSTGWTKVAGAWYYMDEAGAMVTGTQEIDGRSSTFSSSGRWVGYAS